MLHALEAFTRLCKTLSQTLLVAMSSGPPPPDLYCKIKANASGITKKGQGLNIITGIVIKLRSLGGWAGKSAMADTTKTTTCPTGHMTYTMTSESQFHSFQISARSFWKRFFEAISCLRTFNFLLLFTAQKENFLHNFPILCFFFRRYEKAEEKMSKFWFT